MNQIKPSTLLDANMGALRRHRGDLAARLDRVAAKQDVRVFEAADGGIAYGLRRNGHVAPITNPVNPLARINEQFREWESRLRDFTRPILVLGVYPGVEALHLFNLREQAVGVYCEQPLWICVDSLLAFYGFLQAYDATALLASPRVELFTSDEMPAKVDWLRDNPQFPYLFSMITLSPPQTQETVLGPLVDLAQERAQLIEKYQAENADYYARISDRDLAQIVAGSAGRKPRLMVPSCAWSTVVQYSIRDTCAAFERAGWETRILRSPAMLTPHHAMEAIHSFKPDVFLYVNHLRQEVAGVVPDDLLMVSWIQDSSPHINNAEVAEKWNEAAGTRSRDLLVGYTEQLRDYGYREDRLQPLGMIVNPEIFKPRELTGEQKRKYGCDVCFASNCGMPTDRRVKEVLVNLFAEHGLDEATLMGYHDRLWEHYRAGKTITDYCQLVDFLRLDASPYDTVVQLLFWRLNDVVYRHVVIEWLDEYARAHPDFKLHLYGKGWGRHPRFAKYAKGALAHGEELSIAYQAARYCLHLNSLEREHQRVCEIALAGGQLLTRVGRNRGILGGDSSDMEMIFHAAARAIRKNDRLSETELLTEVEQDLARNCSMKPLALESVRREHAFESVGELIRKLTECRGDVPGRESTKMRALLVGVDVQVQIAQAMSRLLNAPYHMKTALRTGSPVRTRSDVCRLSRLITQRASVEDILNCFDHIVGKPDSIRFAVVRHLLDSGEDGHAERVLRQTERGRARSTNELLQYASLLVALGDDEQAVDLLRESYVDNPPGFSRAAWRVFVQEDSAYEKFLQYLDGYRSQGVLRGACLLDCAEALAAGGHMDEAEETVAAAYRSGANLVNGYARCGFTGQFIFRFAPDEALVWFEKDAGIERLRGMLRISHACTLAAAGRLGDALAVVDAAYRSGESCCSGYALVGWHYHAVRNASPEQALGLFEKDMAIDRLQLNARNLYAAAQAALGNNEESRRIIEGSYRQDGGIRGGNTLAAFGNYARNRDLNVLCEMMDGDRRSGRFFRQPWFDYLHAAVLQKLGETDAARTCAGRALRRSISSADCATAWLMSSCIKGDVAMGDLIGPELEALRAGCLTQKTASGEA